MLTNRYLCIVMDYVEGGDLFSHISKQPSGCLTEADARWFYQQFIVAMDYCHSMVRDVLLCYVVIVQHYMLH
jgi:serine/threonine-protein kinase SRK2